MKSCFIEEEGYELWEFDYAQLEMRLGASKAYSKELKLLKIFEEDGDLFNQMAQDLHMVRQDAKQLNYTINYGGGVTKVAYTFGIPKEESSKIIRKYKTTYSRMTAKAQEASTFCRKYGKIKLWSGRYRHFWDRKEDAHKAFNSAMQGGAADIVEKQLVRVWKEYDNEEYCRLLLQVHDSGVFEIRRDKVAELVPKIVATMEDVKPNFGVKFKVEAKIWGS